MTEVLKARQVSKLLPHPVLTICSPTAVRGLTKVQRGTTRGTQDPHWANERSSLVRRCGLVRMIYALFADLLCIRKAKTFNNIVGVIVGVTIHFPVLLDYSSSRPLRLTPPRTTARRPRIKTTASTSSPLARRPTIKTYVCTAPCP